MKNCLVLSLVLSIFGLSCAGTTETTGTKGSENFGYQKKKDELTGNVTESVITFANAEGKSMAQISKTAVLGWFCFGRGREVRVVFHNAQPSYGSSVPVQYRFSNERTETNEDWGKPSGGGTAFISESREIDSFTRRAMSAEWVLFRLMGSSGYTVRFKLNGLDQALGRLSCWPTPWLSE